MKSNTKVRQALQWGIAKLKQAGIDSPVLDAEIFLAYAFHSPIRADRRMDRAWLYAHGDKPLLKSQTAKYQLLIKRRTRREPVAYIVGAKEFYGLDFVVNRHVMIPRPETEVLVEEVLKQIARYTPACACLRRQAGAGRLHDTRYTVIDIGTGSGAIVISIAKACHLKSVTYFATDISDNALRVAKQNALRHGVEKQVAFLRGNLLELLPPNSHDRENLAVQFGSLIVVANLPYLPSAEWRAAQPEIKKWEPRGALDGGRDGLTYYRELFQQLKHHASYSMFHATCLCEFCPHQFPAFKKLTRAFFPNADCVAIRNVAGAVCGARVQIN